MDTETRNSNIRMLKNRIHFLNACFRNEGWAKGLAEDLTTLLKDIQKDATAEAWATINKSVLESMRIVQKHIEASRPIPKYAESLTAEQSKEYTEALTAAVKHLRRQWKRKIISEGYRGNNLVATLPGNYIDSLEKLMYDLSAERIFPPEYNTGGKAFVRENGEERLIDIPRRGYGKQAVADYWIRKMVQKGERVAVFCSTSNDGKRWLDKFPSGVDVYPAKGPDTKRPVLTDHIAPIYFGMDFARSGSDRTVIAHSIRFDNPFVPVTVPIRNNERFEQWYNRYLAAQPSYNRRSSLGNYKSAFDTHGDVHMPGCWQKDPLTKTFVKSVQKSPCLEVSKNAVDIWRKDCEKCEDEVLKAALAYHLCRPVQMRDILNFKVERIEYTNDYTVREIDTCKSVGKMQLSGFPGFACDSFTAAFTMTPNDKK